MSRQLTVIAILLSAALAGCRGPAGLIGAQGEPGPTGATPAPALGAIEGTISDGVAGSPLSGVAVTVADSGGGTLTSSSTGADGKFSFKLAPGLVVLSFALPTYGSPDPMQIGVIADHTVTLAVSMSETASGKPAITLSASGADVGYGTAVPLTATGTSPNGYPLTWSWSNATWPVLGSVSGTGPSGTLTEPTMTQAFAPRPDSQNPGQFISGYAIENRFGIIPIVSDARGQVTAKVTADDGHGQSSSATITINATSVVSGSASIPQNARLYANSGHGGVNAWSLSTPAQSNTVIDDPASSTPSIVPDKPGYYILTETGTGTTKTLTLSAGSWFGVITGGSAGSITTDPACANCHNGTIAPDKFTPWAQTKHATMFSRGLDGALGTHYSGACVECHTVGHDAGALNGGFDDAAAAAGWSFPSEVKTGNWDDMLANAPSVARLANVQCEGCHGPQLTAMHYTAYSTPFLDPRISFKAEDCGTCHGSGAHHIYSEWATPAAPNAAGLAMGHSNRVAATTIGSSATTLSSSCGRCHTAQGYTLYAGLLQKGKVALNSVPAATLAAVTSANAEPVTCVACHEPHDATNPNQLRFFDDTPNLPSGFSGFGMGKGAVCLTCHNSRNGAQTGSDSLTYLHEDGEPYNAGNPTGFSAPHQADQGDVFEGRNAYFMGTSLPMLSKHAAVEDSCVGCHMTLQPKGYLSHGTPARSGHLFRIEDGDRAALCSNCHGPSVDGEGIQAGVETQLGKLSAKMGAAVMTKINSFAGGQVRVRAWDSTTDFYSSTSASNVVLDVVANPVTSVDVEEVHGQVGYVLHFAVPITVPFVDATGAAAPSKDLTSFGVQMGAIKDMQATPAAIYALNGNLIRAGWNYFLIEGDQSKGLHNPTFASAVLSASLGKDLSN